MVASTTQAASAAASGSSPLADSCGSTCARTASLFSYDGGLASVSEDEQAAVTQTTTSRALTRG